MSVQGQPTSRWWTLIGLLPFWSSGFTPRQARFLLLVLEHSGMCLPRQYRTCAGIAHGQQTHRVVDKLITGGFATTNLAPPAHAGRIYHLQDKPWYRLLGEPHRPFDFVDPRALRAIPSDASMAAESRSGR